MRSLILHGYSFQLAVAGLRPLSLARLQHELVFHQLHLVHHRAEYAAAAGTCDRRGAQDEDALHALTTTRTQLQLIVTTRRDRRSQ